MNLLSKASVGAAALAVVLSNPSFANNDPLSFGSSDNGGLPNQSAFYLGGSLGVMNADGFCNNCDDSDMGWKLLGGYDHSDLLAAEVAYNSLGKINSNTNSSEVTGFSVNAVGKFDVNEQVGLFGKAGIFSWSAENSDGDRSATDLMFGAGANYQFNDNIKLRAEWERFMDVETSATARSDLDFLSAGFTYQTL